MIILFRVIPSRQLVLLRTSIQSQLSNRLYRKNEALYNTIITANTPRIPQPQRLRCRFPEALVGTKETTVPVPVLVAVPAAVPAPVAVPVPVATALWAGNNISMMYTNS